ncbi:GLPGLI family protein [Kaistella montana]|uniref:GLPGLI family protein n=1 Tax=Kaistella montana TaxID=1849733 RepID=A0ABW5K9K8_9FLAO|nr:GLPGLI family protein [Kaistella montana]MCQ4035917.1 GLPGLI family protein [Kaistella montana]
MQIWKKNIIFVFLVTYGIVFSQNKSFIYELEFRPSLIKESISKEKFVLDVVSRKSIFRTIDEKKSDSLFHTTNRFSFTTTSFKDFLSVTKDLELMNTHKYIHNFKNLYTIKIDEELHSKIEAETREILEMKTQKAEVSYGGRNWIAWFTNEVPISDGPYVFSGLPGLIIEIYDDKKDYHFSLVQIKNNDGNLYDKDKALPISWKQYEKLALDYYSDPYQRN